MKLIQPLKVVQEVLLFTKILSQQFIQKEKERIILEKGLYQNKNYENIVYSEEITKNLRNSYNSIYKISAYGARALKGGKGCDICGKFKINKPLSITFKLGGREAGGKGGEDCGEYNINDGSRGAGAAIIKYNGEYLIVAGGGGGNSEPEIINGKEKVINRGGNCGKDGEGKLGGKKGGNDEGRKSGGKGESGISLHGGNGASSSDHGNVLWRWRRRWVVWWWSRRIWK